MTCDSSGSKTIDPEPRASLRAWGICVLMLLATMLNYMDRLALSQQATEISRELNLSNKDYAGIEEGFGLAFAVGGVVTGLIADRISPRWLYPRSSCDGRSSVMRPAGSQPPASCWSAECCWVFRGGAMALRLVTAQRMLSRRDRPLGNSIIQSGASLGAIITPVVVLYLATAPLEGGGSRSGSSVRSAWSGSLPGWP